MERIEETCYKSALQRNRERINQQVALLGRTSKVDTSSLTDLIVGPMQLIVTRVCKQAPSQGDRLLITLINVALNHLARDIFVRKPVFKSFWNDLLPPLAVSIGSSPKVVLSSLSNGLEYILKMDSSGVSARRWLDSLTQIGPRCSGVEDLLQVGKILAWTSGMAHFRDAAIKSWSSLDDSLKLAVFGLTNKDRTIEQVSELLQSSPWQKPDGSKVEGEGFSLGGCVGFGGPFLKPPTVQKSKQGIIASDGEEYRLLYADCFGAVSCLVPANPLVLEDLKASLNDEGVKKLISRQAPVDSLQSIAISGDTLAFTVKHSHLVFVLPLLGGETVEAEN